MINWYFCAFFNDPLRKITKSNNFNFKYNHYNITINKDYITLVQYILNNNKQSPLFLFHEFNTTTTNPLDISVTNVKFYIEYIHLLYVWYVLICDFWLLQARDKNAAWNCFADGKFMLGSFLNLCWPTERNMLIFEQ